MSEKCNDYRIHVVNLGRLLCYNIIKPLYLTYTTYLKEGVDNYLCENSITYM